MRLRPGGYPHLEFLGDPKSQRHSPDGLQGVYERPPGFRFTVVETPQYFQFLAKIRIHTNHPPSGRLLDRTILYYSFLERCLNKIA